MYERVHTLECMRPMYVHCCRRHSSYYMSAIEQNKKVLGSMHGLMLVHRWRRATYGQGEQMKAAQQVYICLCLLVLQVNICSRTHARARLPTQLHAYLWNQNHISYCCCDPPSCACYARAYYTRTRKFNSSTNRN